MSVKQRLDKQLKQMAEEQQAELAPKAVPQRPDDPALEAAKARKEAGELSRAERTKNGALRETRAYREPTPPVR